MRSAPRLFLPALLLAGCLPTISPIDSGPLSVGSPCEPFNGVDPCNAWGYVCDLDQSGATSCQYAEFDDPCLPSVGCDPDAGTLTCFNFSADGGTQALVPLCGTPCTVATDCLEATAACFLDVYLADGGLVRACATNFCGTAFEPCSVTGDAGIGTCIPVDPYDNACLQAGPVGLDAPCSGSPAVDAGAYLCQQDEECTFGPSGATACLAICDYLSGALACPSDGTSCVYGYGYCLTPCDPGSGPACTSPFLCQELAYGDQSVGEFCTLP
jgi:hypothetical protein